jgi:hypothetical protein
MECGFYSVSKSFILETFNGAAEYLKPKLLHLTPILPITTKDFKLLKFPPRDLPKILLISAIAISLIASAVAFFKGLITLGILCLITAESLSLGKKYLEKYRELKKTQSAYNQLHTESNLISIENKKLSVEIGVLKENNTLFEATLRELKQLVDVSQKNLEDAKKEFEDFKASNESLRIANEQLNIQLGLLSKITGEIYSAQQKLTELIEEKTKISTTLQKETEELEGVRLRIKKEVTSLEEVSKTLKARVDVHPNLRELIEALDRISGSSLVQKPLLAQ